ncbi:MULTISPECIES: tannase/feruloyl esterase family alpha/beta hydrolase [Variovorax]|jgi:pimeloyl-ACP methyl ester carboxylesterase|uniref:tannase/feruloyl esterase family alpha/beta hydrolase n=2 Tax=Comamonadaceae TaxID=80864 RepID=UPI00086EAB87|nr:MULTISPECIES: tannase/feruloyl esterase family alpha/beta hydrolase [Variovorax]ODU17436.1 MAG: feruloyl esterase [Variovorax sp. SCN 67-85]ODV25855.1 MAG: feruloyl esterase [Variovorax sp. SCN 67-20]MBN8754383.1 tannase/feruloyl esterase family alpha/beta hydrolase [Variovorax sp.]OJZ03997.1 MAG: feruloyl esterase [Variovorax sp. 67-131]UKI10135.1 tannase/feruloyl esterase family alpha/beta hydrolase [Variovorax paradoxus]
MRTTRPASMIRAVLYAIGLSLLSLILAACGGGGGGGGGGAVGLLPTTPPAGGNNPPAGNPAANDPPDNPSPPPVLPAVACADLNGKSLPASLISLPTQGATVTSATPVAAGDTGNTLGDYCRVRGTIQPVDPSSQSINFAVNLPEKWNQKTIHFGGGGFDGVLIDGTEVIRFGPAGKPAPLALGYATYGDDSGHQSSSITDGKFAANDEQLANYGGNSLKKTRDVAQALVFARYAVKPKHAYFLGTSTGGRDALSYIQRWPGDYDGVIANEPALNYTGTRLSNVAVGRALYYNNGTDGWMDLSETLMVQKAAMQACDKLDGAADNIVSNVESCRMLNAQIVASLRCPGGTKTSKTCLSDAQIATVHAIESPLDFTTYSLANGVKRAGGYNLLEGALVAGPYTTRDLGTRNVPGNPATSSDANMYVTGDQWAKFFVKRDAGFNTLTFDPLNPGSDAARVTEVSNLTDATNPNLTPFFAHGGRLIMLHGLADEVISPNSTIDYYKQLIATVGQPAVDQSVRFYTVPGMGHGTGSFIPNWDSLAALEGWVEAGLAPATGVAVDAVAGTYGRTRPLCQFPAWPKYRGSGSLDAAVNYSCVTEVGDPLACPNLPASVTSYKGGNSFGEELRVQIDPATMAYTVTIDASLLRTAGTQRTGTLVSQGSCSYISGESGAVFSFGAGGVLSGGVNAPSGGGFSPLLAFQNSFAAAPVSGDFKSVANIFNVVGVQQGSGGASAFASSVRLRQAGTFQYCRDPVSGGFMVYDLSCTQTEKGYVAYNTTRASFDLFTTSPTGSAVTTGGTLTGSMVIGLVNGVAVPLHLVRESAASIGMRVYGLQQSLAAGAADGSYALVSVKGENHDATVAGSGLNLGGAAAGLSYDTPVPGVAQADAGRPGNFIFNSGVLGFVSSPGTNAALEFGVRH